MPDTFTANYNLTKPEPGSNGWDAKLNSDLDIIDANIKSVQDAADANALVNAGKAPLANPATPGNLTLLNADGSYADSGVSPGSNGGLDANFLQGNDSTAFAPSVHQHNNLDASTAFSAGILPISRGGTGAVTKKSAREKLGIYSGTIKFDGTPIRLPAGWSSIKNSTGAYTITHNLGASNYDFTAMCQANGDMNAVSQTPGANSIVVFTWFADAQVDSTFTFNLIKD